MTRSVHTCVTTARDPRALLALMHSAQEVAHVAADSLSSLNYSRTATMRSWCRLPRVGCGYYVQDHGKPLLPREILYRTFLQPCAGHGGVFQYYYGRILYSTVL